MKRIWHLLIALVLLAGCATEKQPATTKASEPAAPPVSAPAQNGISGEIAFIQGGNLWIRPMNGVPKRLLDGGGYADPLISKSGNWVLVRKNEKYYTVKTDGTAVKELPVTGSSAVMLWSPTEDRVAYLTEGRLGVIGADGSGEKQLTQFTPPAQASRMAWSPDGKWIAYDLNNGAPGVSSGAAVLKRISVAGGEPEEVFAVKSEEPLCVILAGYAADGNSLLYWPQPSCSASILADGLALMSVPIGGQKPEEVINPTLLLPDFMSVNTQGARAVAAGAGRVSWSSKTVYAIPKGGKPVLASPKGVAATSPALSPDGKWLAYAAMPDAGAQLAGDAALKALMQRHLWLGNGDGSGAKPLTTDARYRDEYPIFTGDGQHLLFVRLTADNKASLWITPVENPKPELVVQIDPPADFFGFYGWINWSAELAYWPGP